MKRLFWFGVGTAAGAGGTIWTQRKVRNQLDALSPDQLVVRAGRRAGVAGRSFVEALNDGRDAMRSRESELRTRYQPRQSGDAARDSDLVRADDPARVSDAVHRSDVHASEKYRPRTLPRPANRT